MATRGARDTDRRLRACRRGKGNTSEEDEGRREQVEIRGRSYGITRSRGRHKARPKSVKGSMG